ncbi:LOW QUALITY PROTEIN: hypothetical protein JCM24511_01328 [Saitozyma sp. JCM 24511]|nr:LOW QUALITY PROTEIN: hypothetical protein JCM24511_01328 [Saitozyma sp. JCM 24511]
MLWKGESPPSSTGSTLAATTTTTTTKGTKAGTPGTPPRLPPFVGNTCPPLTVRYAYIDEKLRGEALAGTMAPGKLPNLLPDTSPLAVAGASEDDDEVVVRRVGKGDDTLTLKSKSAKSGQTLAKFIKGIPNPVVFSAAWGIYTDLVLHGLRAYDSQTVADAHSALRHHEFWVLERSLDFTWESICAYHVAVATERSASGFQCETWYRNVDADLWTRHQVRRPAARAPDRSRKDTATAAASSSSGPPICNNYNMGVCRTSPCPRNFRHACKNCGKDGHRAADAECKSR